MMNLAKIFQSRLGYSLILLIIWIVPFVLMHNQTAY
jgi:hypothetical protein